MKGGNEGAKQSWARNWRTVLTLRYIRRHGKKMWGSEGQEVKGEKDQPSHDQQEKTREP